MFGQGVAGFVQNKTSIAPQLLLVNCGMRQRPISTHFTQDVSLPLEGLDLCLTSAASVLLSLLRLLFLVTSTTHPQTELQPAVTGNLRNLSGTTFTPGKKGKMNSPNEG